MKARDQVTAKPIDTSTFDNPADKAALADIAARTAAGEDPFGDNEVNTVADDEQNTGGAPVVEGEGIEAVETKNDDAALLQKTEQSTAAPAPPPAPAVAAPAAQVVAPPTMQFKTRNLQELQAGQAKLYEEKAVAFKAYSEGHMDADEFTALDSRVMQGLMQISVEQALATANTQTALASSESALAIIKAEAKIAGIDYDTDKGAADQFDALATALAVDPAIAALNDREFFSKVHATLLTVRGIAVPQTTQAAPGKPAAREDMVPGVVTLRGLPAASTPLTGGGVTEQLSQLHGIDFQDAFARLPKAQREAWMDS